MAAPAPHTDYQALYEALLRQFALQDVQYQALQDNHQALQDNLLFLQQDLTVLQQEQKAHIQIITDLRLRIDNLTKLIFCKKTERFIPADPAEVQQLTLQLEPGTIAACKIEDGQQVSYTRTPAQAATAKRQHPGRNILPAHLRREPIILQPADIDLSNLKHIGDDITEILEYIPGELYAKQYIRPKYVIAVSDTQTSIITASLPGRLMEKCKAGEGLLAQIVVDKYCDHLPLYRQLQRLGRQGINIPQSTMTEWVTTVLNHLGALYEAHKKQIISSAYLHADETPIKVLDSDKKGASHQGYYWVYCNSRDKTMLFDYRPGRDRSGPDDILKDFKGYLQTDGYASYNHFGNRGDIVHLCCMAHARRKFHEVLNYDKARAEHALTLFGRLYDIERHIKEQALDAAATLEVRSIQAVPLLEELHIWMKQQLLTGMALPTSPLGKAIAYSLDRWDKLCIYTTNGILNIDNNPVENAIRPVAIGRKNYLFAGSHAAAQRAAMVYSLLATCKTHGVNPYEWLNYVLKYMHLYTTSNIAELLPQSYALAKTTAEEKESIAAS